MPISPSTHAILIEPKRVYALGPDRGRRTLVQEPLAYFPLPDGIGLSGHDWHAVEDEFHVYLTGSDAVLVANQVADRTEPVFPLDLPDLCNAPQIAWAALAEIMSRLVSADAGPITTITPTDARDASNLWLHALPETLLADVHPDYRTITGAKALIADLACSGVAWGWIIGEVGISIAASYEGRVAETFLHRHSVGILPNSELTWFALIERAFAESLSLFKAAWASAPSPQIHLRMVTTEKEARLTEAAVARAVTRLGLGSDFRGERFSLTELLEIAIRT